MLRLKQWYWRIRKIVRRVTHRWYDKRHPNLAVSQKEPPRKPTNQLALERNATIMPPADQIVISIRLKKNVEPKGFLVYISEINGEDITRENIGNRWSYSAIVKRPYVYLPEGLNDSLVSLPPLASNTPITSLTFGVIPWRQQNENPLECVKGIEYRGKISKTRDLDIKTIVKVDKW